MWNWGESEVIDGKAMMWISCDVEAPGALPPGMGGKVHDGESQVHLCITLSRTGLKSPGL